MARRSGFTLMELLLVVAILAIIAAVAAPQFFRTSSVAMNDARAMLMKANYQAIKAALNMAMWDDMNNPNLTAAQKLTGGTEGFIKSNSYLRKLVDRGFLQEPACFLENEQGKKLYFAVRLSATGATPANPYATVASAPIFMENTNLYQVFVMDANQVWAVNIDEQLRSGVTTSWEQIWNQVRGLTGI